MKLNLIGPFVVNAPFGTEIAFSKGLRKIGHEVNEVDPNVDPLMAKMDPLADVTVVFKTCCGHEDQLDSLQGPVIVYQPDDARFPHIRQMMLMMRKYSNLFLSFDDHGATVAKSMGYRAAETLLLTADPELYSPSPETIERDIDISFVGSLGDPAAHASRREMLKIIHREGDKRGWKRHFEITQDIPRVVDIYRRSKIVVNHATDVGQQFGTGFGLQCRHFEVGMTRTALLSNQRIGIDPPYPLQFVSFFDEHSLVSQIEYMLEDENWKEHGEKLYQDIRDGHMPEHRAHQLISFIVRNA